MMHSLPTQGLCCCAVVALFSVGCGDNRTPYSTADAVAPLDCVPDLDGRLDADEFSLYAGQTGNYDVSTLQKVDSAGSGKADARSWALDWSHADDELFAFEIVDVRDTWFADRIPDELYDRFDGELVALPSDVAQKYLLVLGKDADATWLLALASTDAHPDDEGQTWVLYDTPIAIHRFPMLPGRSWVSTGQADGATLPLPGTPGLQLQEDRVDTYEIAVTEVGELDLGDYRFTDAFKLEQRVTLAFPGNPALPTTVQTQVQFFVECGGEVARLTARQNDSAEPITLAQEARRARLD